MERVLVILASEVGQPSGLSDVAATGKTAKIQDLWPVVAENKGKNERLEPVREPTYQHIYTIYINSKDPRQE